MQQQKKHQHPEKPRRLTIRLTEADQQLIDALKRDYNVTSTQGVIRLALRLAQMERFPMPQPMEKK